MEKKDDLTQVQQFVKKYDEDLQKLLPYIPYFEERGARDVARDYDGEQGHSSMTFPVYDGTLMSFVKLCQKTSFMDRNYSYAYTRRRIKNKAQEEAAIKNATMKDEDLLNGVLTKYVMEGMRKTGVWQDAVERKLFLNVIKKYKEIMEYCKRF
ncbi:MAG: hypothetical protein II799_02595 [Lachnospiraceae bacterium]|nr:hypothetical protein [Lachnospiraceae bacterium]